jgi:hypothetical protein
MKYFILNTLLVLFSVSLFAQEFDIREFKADPNDMAARRFEKLDVNGNVSALIKITTNIKGMQFDSNSGIVDIVHQPDGYWVYVVPDERRIKLMAKDYISLDVDFPEPAKSLSVYHLVVATKGVYHTSDLVRLTFRMNQSNVYVQSGESAPILSLGSSAVFNVPKGERKFRFVKDGFAEEEVTLNVEEEVVKDITLRVGKPFTNLEASSNIIVESDPSGADVYLNDQKVGVTPYNRKNIAGKYTLRIEHPMYYEHIEQFELKEGVNQNLPKVILKPRFGYLNATSIPTGSEVLLNNKSIGTTPLRQEKISSGFHEVIIRKSNYHDYRESFSINDGDTKDISATLMEAFGSMIITSEPNGAKVFIDGREVGVTPYRNTQLASGRYNIVISKDLYTDSREVITISDGQEVSKFYALTQNYGILRISAADAEIFIDGARVGQGTYTANLTPGQYRLKASKDRHTDDERTVLVELGQTQNITLRPKPREGVISITSTPFEARGADIYLNGQKQPRTTPANITVLVGDYNVTLKKSGFIDASQNVTVQEGRESTVNLNMTSFKGSLHQKAKRYKTAKILYGTAAVASLGTGTYYLLSANNLNEQYKTATTDAGLIYDRMERHDLYSMIAYGAAVPFTVMTIIKATQQKRAEKRVNMALIPLRDGFVFGMAYNF